MTQKSKTSNQLEQLKKQFNGIFLFSRQLFSNWLLWVFLILDIIALIIQYVDQRFQLPQYVYIGLALIGFFWASFKIYQEQLGKHEKLLKEYEALANDPSKIVVEPKTSLAITFIEGNEYNYKINEPYQEPEAQLKLLEIKLKGSEEKSKGHFDDNGIFYIENELYYILPSSHLFVNLRIMNDGNIPLDILAINSKCEMRHTPFMNFGGNEVTSDGKELSYPKHLQPGQIFLCQISHHIRNKTETNAQFAASLRSINPDISYFIEIDTLDQTGDRNNLQISSKLSLRPAIDLYFAQWQTYKQEKLLRLAGIGGSEPNI